jgi:hypothetical protein
MKRRPMNQERDIDDDEAHRLATDPEAIPTIVEQLPDPRAVAVLKALAPVIAKMHRCLILLEALHRAGRLTRSRPQL